MPDNRLLAPVPHFQQSAKGRCLEACACMLLARLGDPVVESDVSKLFQSTEVGTPSSRVLRLKQWGYRVTYRSATISELHNWLAGDNPPIVFLRTLFLDYWAEDVFHAAVVVGIEDQRIYLNDPAFDMAPQACSLDGFLAAWAEKDEGIALIER